MEVFLDTNNFCGSRINMKFWSSVFENEIPESKICGIKTVAYVLIFILIIFFDTVSFINDGLDVAGSNVDNIIAAILILSRSHDTLHGMITTVDELFIFI